MLFNTNLVPVPASHIQYVLTLFLLIQVVHQLAFSQQCCTGKNFTFVPQAGNNFVRDSFVPILCIKMKPARNTTRHDYHELNGGDSSGSEDYEVKGATGGLPKPNFAFPHKTSVKSKGHGPSVVDPDLHPKTPFDAFNNIIVAGMEDDIDQICAEERELQLRVLRRMKQANVRKLQEQLKWLDLEESGSHQKVVPGNPPVTSVQAPVGAGVHPSVPSVQVPPGPGVNPHANSAQVQPCPVDNHPVTSEITAPPGATAITLNALREYEDLNAEVQKRIKGLGTDYYSDSGDSCASNATVNSHKSHTERSKKRRGKSLKSGREVKAFQYVQTQLVWPHTQLKFEFLNSKTRHSTLDLGLLVAGETQHMLVNNPPSEEVTGRLRLLQLVAYHSKTYTWQSCLNFHGSVLLDIERGLRTWSDNNFQALEAQSLYQNPLNRGNLSSKSKSSQLETSQNGTLFCQDYNKGKCRLQSEHECQIKGITRTVNHICAKCWIKEKVKRIHPETSGTCPNKA